MQNKEEGIWGTVMRNMVRSGQRGGMVRWVAVIGQTMAVLEGDTGGEWLALHLSRARHSGRLTWVRLQQPQEQRYPFYQCVWYFRVSKQRYGCQCLGSLTCTQMLTPAIAHRGFTDTVRESALKVDSGRKIPCRTLESNLCQRRTGPTLCQLCYIPASF